MNSTISNCTTNVDRIELLTNIPFELKGHNKSWILYNLIDRGGKKPAKVPFYMSTQYNPDGFPLTTSHSATETWVTYETICDYIENEYRLPVWQKTDEELLKENPKSHGWNWKNPEFTKYEMKKHDGIGYVFSEDCLYVGIDYDNWFEDDNKTIKKESKDILNKLNNSYTEMSQSGQGGHTIVKLKSLEEKKILLDVLKARYGNLSGVRNDDIGVECYTKLRFFVMTGKVIEGFENIKEVETSTILELFNSVKKEKERKSVYDSKNENDSIENNLSVINIYNPNNFELSPKLTDKQVIEKCKKDRKTGERFKELIVEIGKDGNSGTDIETCGCLANYTQDLHQIARIMRNSPRYRKKFDRYDYLVERTAKTAIARRNSFYTVSKSKTYGSDELCKNKWDPNLTENKFYYLNHEGKEALDHTKLRDHLKNNHHIFCTELGFYIYQEGVYNLTHKNILAKLIETHVKKKDQQERTITEAINRLSREFKEIESLDIHSNIINLNNGYLEFDIETGNYEMKDHTPEKIFTQKFNIDYDKNKDCPIWKKFLNEVLSPTQQLLIQEIMGYMLIADNRAKRIYGLLGISDCGKSVILTTTNNIIGKKLVSNLSWQKIAKTDNRFSAYQLYNKLVNITGDLPQKPLDDTGLLKDLSGDDYIDAEPKGKNNFSFKNTCRLFASMNKMPSAPTDKSNAWYDRLLVVPFEKNIPEEQQDKHLIDKFDLEGVLNWAIIGLQRLLKNKLIYSETAENTNIINQYKIDNDSALKFISECCLLRDDIPSKDLYKAYCYYCNETGLLAYKKANFESNILLNNNIKRDKNTGDIAIGKQQGQQRGFKGISLNPESDFFEDINLKKNNF